MFQVKEHHGNDHHFFPTEEESSDNFNQERRSKTISGSKKTKEFSSQNKGKNNTSTMIEMQVFNDFTTQKKENTQVFSEEESRVTQSQLEDDSIQVQRKAKSLETERNNNKKYKLDNQKISKEYSQDFLEEYKGVYNPSNQTPRAASSKKLSGLVKKNYESDANELKKNTSSAANSDAGGDTFNNSKDDEDDDFLYY